MYMSNQVKEFKLSFMTMEEMRKMFEEASEKVMNKEGNQLLSETIHGHSSFNVYISPIGYWWVDQGFTTEEEWITFMSEQNFITEGEADGYRESGLRFVMTTMTEFDGEGRELHVYSKEMLTTAKEAMFVSFVNDYDTYMSEVWLELDDMM